ncbi:hypothetical protein BJ138DRAFT_1154831 [Hygrophoropsis aurantiaca]|uniref:Uncharacterized protein n=1 Tax=Hygrophoropsis aurantiaca TaxID=72124 RepID=A0ACB8AA56_9AGAM|nr:hypothetical protein BJ138DRAFT_1154831 [Hygrophoropsis aurantiaca]
MANIQQITLYCQIPAIAYGGPDVPPETPSPDSTKLAESLVLVEFVADLFPQSGILPTDPYENVLQGIDAIRPLLPEPGNVVDIAIAPFIARLSPAAQHDIGKYEAGDGHKLLSPPQFAKFNAYKTLVLERPSVIATFDNVGFKLFVPI